MGISVELFLLRTGTANGPFFWMETVIGRDLPNTTHKTALWCTMASLSQRFTVGFAANASRSNPMVTSGPREVWRTFGSKDFRKAFRHNYVFYQRVANTFSPIMLLFCSQPKNAPSAVDESHKPAWCIAVNDASATCDILGFVWMLRFMTSCKPAVMTKSGSSLIAQGLRNTSCCPGAE